jgi:ferric-dicitrate binding protein FerR (iron transport regulator)
VAIDQGYRHATLAQGEALLNVVESARPFVLHAGCAEMETIAAKLLARAELVVSEDTWRSARRG